MQISAALPLPYNPNALSQVYSGQGSEDPARRTLLRGADISLPVRQTDTQDERVVEGDVLTGDSGEEASGYRRHGATFEFRAGLTPSERAVETFREVSTQELYSGRGIIDIFV